MDYFSASSEIFYSVGFCPDHLQPLFNAASVFIGTRKLTGLLAGDVLTCRLLKKIIGFSDLLHIRAGKNPAITDRYRQKTASFFVSVLKSGCSGKLMA